MFGEEAFNAWNSRDEAMGEVRKRRAPTTTNKATHAAHGVPFVRLVANATIMG